MKVSRPYVGLRMVNFRPRGNGGGGGGEQLLVLVTDIKAGSPAAQAGLRVHDVIVSIDGKKVSHTRDVFNSIGWDVGKTLRVGVRRNGSGGLSGGVGDEEEVVLVTGKQ